MDKGIKLGVVGLEIQFSEKSMINVTKFHIPGKSSREMSITILGVNENFCSIN